MEAVTKVEETAAVDLDALLDAGEGPMVTLVAGETRLMARRAVLAARSPVFSAMFSHDTLESSSNEVTITDVEGPVLRELLAYCHTLRTPHPSSMTPQVLAAADKYDLSGLKTECEQQLASLLTVESAAATAVLAVRHTCPSLTKAAVAFIKANFQVLATQGWADAVHNQPKDVVEVCRLLGQPPIKIRYLSTGISFHALASSFRLGVSTVSVVVKDELKSLGRQVVVLCKIKAHNFS
ncbi:speckle-type POZ protein-like [Schistocerca piceifrons]|uniref:speckle-type POZ protein-like n=1 Tax=Schistocerca piceifrons TaxID=274613 RepID=UPI001F5FA3AE|nr:speckle-type POZ protein-like [Schistocerca piceifrons]